MARLEVGPRGPVPKFRAMTNDDLFGYLRTEPFRPFRLHMVSGRTFDIRHPEMVRVGKRDIVIFSFVSTDPQIYDKWDSVSLPLVESISHLETSASKS